MSAEKGPGGLPNVGMRFNFYKDGYTASLTINVVQTIAIVILILCVFHFANRPVEREYFSVDCTGRMQQQQPMDSPHLPESALLDYAVRSVSEGYTFDASNYRDVMTSVGKYFTPEGHADFLNSMQPQIKYVLDNVLIASAVADGTPVLSNSGRSPNGVFAWKIKVPIVVTFRTQTQSSTVKRIVTLVIVNRPTYETPFGVGISSWSAKDL